MKLKLVTSRELADETGKSHSNVMRDIRLMVKRLSSPDCTGKSISPDGWAKGFYKQVNHSRMRKMIILGDELATEMRHSYNYRSFGKGMKEDIALSTIEQMIGRSLSRQHKVGPYYIDGLDLTNNTAYEIDEGHHRYQQKADRERERFIANEIGCNFVRIKV